ncbi:PAS domain-containing protein [Szabonella alba]|uniref:histidine kinase n=1 Tax=Szabonella alba TaxID=2804194 RepID=A0A8K0V715_9RHOB|nr:PAS domain-containing protein [Szabonella alba]MBL4916929.1 PAS domain-containing protein [Szabonella alba]
MITPSSRNFQPEEPSHADMVQSLPHIVWTAQPGGWVDWFSREFEQYTGFSDALNAQHGWVEAVHPDDRGKLAESWVRSREAAHSYTTELRVWSQQTQSWRANLVSARAQLSPDGQIVRWFGTVTDIQSLRDAENERAFELKFRKIESEILRAIGTGGTLQQIFTLICHKIEDLLPDARTVITHIAPDGFIGEGFSISMPAAFIDACKGMPVGAKAGSCGTAAYRRELVIVEDTLTDPLWEDCRELAFTYGLRSSISCPVLDEAGNSVATLALHFLKPFQLSNAEIMTARRLSEFVFLALSATRDRELLQQSEERYRSLFDLMPVSVWEEDVSVVLEDLAALKRGGLVDFRSWIDDNPDFVVEMIRKIRIVGVNQAALSVHRVASVDALAERLATFGADPALRPDFADHLCALFADDTYYESQRTITDADGKSHDILLRIIRATPTSSRLLVVEMDLTDQIQAEHRFRTIAQATSDVIYERDIAADHVWVSNGLSQHFGYPPFHEGHPRSFWIENVHAEDRDRVVAEMDRAIDTDGAEWSHEYRFRKFAGEFVPVRENAVIVRDLSGKAVRVIGNMTDLSEQKSLEERLRRSQRMEAVGRLTGGIAHDFNNILAIIIGNAEFLLDYHPEGTPERRMVENIDQAADRASELTAHLLGFSRQQALVPKPTDLNAVIGRTHTLLHRSLTPAIHLELDLAPDAHFASIDQPMFESALLNLCVNARDAMPSGGRLTISTRNRVLDGSWQKGDFEQPQAGRYVEITVSDTGTGMSADVRAWMFEPFFTTKPAGKGSGLGLPMVYGFVKQSRGHLRVESAPGAGTSISFYLPAIEPESTEIIATDAKPAEHGMASAAVLVVEDESLVREHLVALLQSMGHEVTATIIPHEALALIEAGQHFDIIISDIVMPGGMNGVEFARTLRDSGIETPILLVSGFTDDIEILSGGLQDRIDFLKKPYRRSDIVERMQNLLTKPAM